MPAMLPNFNSFLFPGPHVDPQSGKCPYCGGDYGLQWRGCKNRCPDSLKLIEMLTEACIEEEQHGSEEEGVKNALP